MEGCVQLMKRIYIVPHTHWDREWYLSYQHFRIRLTRLIKGLLDILDNDPDYVSYHLDGQASVLDDYLDIHPEDRERLSTFIAEGRIKVGPWYVQPDESLVSGESLIRNFSLGIRKTEEMGGSLKFGYLPDMFGHISQLPQLLRGFGMSQAVVWRGLGDVAARSQSELLWEGADGSELFTYRLSNQMGYSELFRLYSDPDKAAEQIRGAAERHLIPASGIDTLLLMVGVDHMEPQRDLSRIIREAAPLLPEYELVFGTIDGFLNEAEEKTYGKDLFKAHGELRDTNRVTSGGFNFLLANVLSSRMYLKQANAQAQYLLERWAEPFSTIACGLAGNRYPDRLLEQSWIYLLQNHPHDSICGCSRDEVHRQMMTRFEWSTEIAGQLKDEALYSLLAQVDTSVLPNDRIIFHAINPLEHTRRNTVMAELYLPADAPAFRTIDIYDSEGKRLPSQVMDVRPEFRCVHHHETAVRDMAMLHNAAPPEERGILPGLEYSLKATVAFVPQTLPALGYATFTAVPNRKRVPERGVIAKGNSLENEWLKADVHFDGSVTLYDKKNGHCYQGLLVFEDGGDGGDGYTYSAPLIDEVFTTRGIQASVTVAADGEALGVLRIERSWELPAGLASDRKRRALERRICRLVTEVSLGAEDEWLGVKVIFDNQAADHRLRVALPTGLKADTSWSSAAFDLVERSVEVVQPDEAAWIEDSVGVFHNHGFAGMTDAGGERGFAVAPLGLPECEATADGTLYLTLLRAVGYLGSPDPLTIVSGAGPNFPTPEGQCQGTHTFRFALVPHQGRPLEGEVWRRAHEHHLAVQTVQMRHSAKVADQNGGDGTGALPLTQSFLQLGGERHSFVLSALKKADSRDSILIRLFNASDVTGRTMLRWWQRIGEAYAVDLAENRLAPLVVTDEQEIAIEADGKKIVTIEIVPV
jgi:mannosylglycerate hydrolase